MTPYAGWPARRPDRAVESNQLGVLREKSADADFLLNVFVGSCLHIKHIAMVSHSFEGARSKQFAPFRVRLDILAGAPAVDRRAQRRNPRIS